MLDADTFNLFIGKANVAYQQFCVWLATNNEFAKHQASWNKIDPEIGPFALENFTRKHGCKYKNFWSIVVPTLQHGWTLATARLFDPAYHSRDTKREKPRISLDYILIKLEDEALSGQIRKQLELHRAVINSLRKYRDNVHAHNAAYFVITRIEAGTYELFHWLENIISTIKELKPYFSMCGSINLEYNEKLSQCGVDEIFEALLLVERRE